MLSKISATASALLIISGEASYYTQPHYYKPPQASPYTGTYKPTSYNNHGHNHGHASAPQYKPAPTYYQPKSYYKPAPVQNVYHKHPNQYSGHPTPAQPVKYNPMPQRVHQYQAGVPYLPSQTYGLAKCFSRNPHEFGMRLEQHPGQPVTLTGVADGLAHPGDIITFRLCQEGCGVATKPVEYNPYGTYEGKIRGFKKTHGHINQYWPPQKDWQQNLTGWNQIIGRSIKLLKGPYTVSCCDIERDDSQDGYRPSYARPTYTKPKYSPYLMTGGTSSHLPTNVKYYGAYGHQYPAPAYPAPHGHAYAAPAPAYHPPAHGHGYAYPAPVYHH